MTPALLLYFALVNDVKALLARNDLAAAEATVKASQKQLGNTAEYAAALSWLARGELTARHPDRADAYAIEARKLTDQLLRTHKLDSDPWLPTAAGAAIEVHAQVLAGRGENAEAVEFLAEQLALFRTTSIRERIQKNLNLLSLEGKPAPPLDSAEWLGAKPSTLTSLRGHPVLLFFWAHWCSDCKAEVEVVARAEQMFVPKGLVVIAPTRYYGFAARGEEVAPPAEKKYIDAVRKQFYAPLGDVPSPLSNANFERYGASTTPTLVLIDSAGVVRMYHPGTIALQDLAVQVQAVLRSPGPIRVGRKRA